MKFGNIYKIFLLPLLIFSGCERSVPEHQSSDSITFYVHTQPQAKAIIENTDDLIKMALPLYVSDEGTGSQFSGTKIEHTSNGVWRSNVVWENRNYTFFAYIKSSTDGANKGILEVSNNGRSVKVTQPFTYSTNYTDYADYLLSHRVTVNGAAKPLVVLNMERVTTGVELYMTKAPNMSSVKLKKAEFRNILRSAQYNIHTHITSDEYEINKSSNQWAVNADQKERTTYTHVPTGEGLELAISEQSKDRFAPENKVMSFLTVQQSLNDINHAILHLEYEVEENGIYKPYTAEFILGQYPIKSWTIGHKIRYYVSVDTSIKLEGSIEPWKEVDSIEGTFLPK